MLFIRRLSEKNTHSYTYKYVYKETKSDFLKKKKKKSPSPAYFSQKQSLSLPPPHTKGYISYCACFAMQTTTTTLNTVLWESPFRKEPFEDSLFWSVTELKSIQQLPKSRFPNEGPFWERRVPIWEDPLASSSLPTSPLSLLGGRWIWLREPD